MADDDLSRWLSTAAVIETRFEWLKQITRRADAEFMFRAIAIWASEAQIDSAASLLERRAELEAQPFWQDALSSTRSRLHGVLDEMASSQLDCGEVVPAKQGVKAGEAGAASPESCPNGVCQRRVLRDTLNVDEAQPNGERRRSDHTASGKTETAVFGLG